jgi:hypothetical protein
MFKKKKKMQVPETMTSIFSSMKIVVPVFIVMPMKIILLKALVTLVIVTVNLLL